MLQNRRSLHRYRIYKKRVLRECQDIESMCSGKLSHVPSQTAVVPSPRSMLSRDRSMPPDTWNLSGTQGNVFGNHRCLIKEFFTPRIKVPQVKSQCREVQGDLSREVKNELEAQFQCLCSQGSRPPLNSCLQAEVPQNSMAVQQRLQISELQFDIFPTPSSFSCWKMRFKNQVTTCSDFPSDTVLWIKEVEMVDSVDELKSSRSIEGKNFPNFEMLDAKIASALNKIIQNSYFKKKVSLEDQIAQKDLFLRE